VTEVGRPVSGCLIWLGADETGRLMDISSEFVSRIGPCIVYHTNVPTVVNRLRSSHGSVYRFDQSILQDLRPSAIDKIHPIVSFYFDLCPSLCSDMASRGCGASWMAAESAFDTLGYRRHGSMIKRM
jgi:hypothetical protein